MMFWSYVFDEQALVTLFKEQVPGSLDYAEPWCSPLELHLVEMVSLMSLEQVLLVWMGCICCSYQRKVVL